MASRPPNLHTLPCVGTYRTRTNARGTFGSLAELERNSRYKDITAIGIKDLGQVNHPDYVGAIERLPLNLQSLDVVDCNGLKQFPMCLPRTVHTVFLVNTRVRAIPDIAHLDNLETLNMHGSGVATLDRPLPASLRTLVLDHNGLRSIDYALLPAELAKLSVAHNSLIVAPPADLGIDVDFHNNSMEQWRFVTAVVAAGACAGAFADSWGGIRAANDVCEPQQRVREANDAYERQQRLRAATANNFVTAVVGVGAAGRKTASNVYEQRQNVHDSTIQESVMRSIEVLCGLHERRSEPDFLELLKRRLEATSRRHWLLCLCGRLLFWRRNEFDFLDDWVVVPTTVGTTGRTLASLLERAYVVASVHEASDELFLRLAQELREGDGVCFTGKISRVVNAFAGFVDGIDVKISARAELHARINVILAKKADAKDPAALLQEFLSLIASHCDMPEGEFDAWLEAYVDF